VSWIRGFARFWYDFLVGDSMALAIGGIVVLILGYGLVEVGAGLEAQLILPLAAVATIAASLPELRR